MEANASLECIRTVASTNGCEILQVYEYEANEYGYEVKCK